MFKGMVFVIRDLSSNSISVIIFCLNLETALNFPNLQQPFTQDRGFCRMERLKKEVSHCHLTISFTLLEGVIGGQGRPGCCANRKQTLEVETKHSPPSNLYGNLTIVKALSPVLPTGRQVLLSTPYKYGKWGSKIIVCTNIKLTIVATYVNRQKVFKIFY